MVVKAQNSICGYKKCMSSCKRHSMIQLSKRADHAHDLARSPVPDRGARSLACCEIVTYAPPTSSVSFKPGGNVGVGDCKSPSCKSNSSTQFLSDKNLGVLMNCGKD